MECVGKKYLFVYHSSELTGGERAVTELVNELSYNNKIIVVLPCRGPIESIISSNVQILISKQWWWVKKDKYYSLRDKLWLIKNIIFLYRSAIDIIREQDPDIVFSNTSVIPVFAFAAKKMKKKHVWMIHELVKIQFNKSFLLGDFLTMKLINFLSDIIYVNSFFVKKECAKYIPEEKLFLLRQSVSVGTYIKKHSHSPIINLIVVGTIVETKGQKDAVEACRILNENGVLVNLRIVGLGEDGDYCRSLREISSGNVTFIPFQKDMDKLYLESDIALVCSSNEAFGRVTIESMKYGLPVIASNCGANKDLIIDGCTGYLYEKKSIQSLVDKIMLLLDYSERNRIGQNAYKYAWGNYSKDQMIKDFNIPITNL